MSFASVRDVSGVKDRRALLFPNLLGHPSTWTECRVLLALPTEVVFPLQPPTHSRLTPPLSHPLTPRSTLSGLEVGSVGVEGHLLA